MAEIGVKFPWPGSVSREAREGKYERIRRGREGRRLGVVGALGLQGKVETGRFRCGWGGTEVEETSDKGGPPVRG
jgi:hypothetical protein